ncbi:hypothetical protein J0H58_06595 [bacterium]|nr:hypothetical protein [bacterium]
MISSLEAVETVVWDPPEPVPVAEVEAAPEKVAAPLPSPVVCDVPVVTHRSSAPRTLVVSDSNSVWSVTDHVPWKVPRSLVARPYDPPTESVVWPDPDPVDDADPPAATHLPSAARVWWASNRVIQTPDPDSDTDPVPTPSPRPMK